MQEKVQEGIYLLSTLGTIIEDEGYENDGNILIQTLDDEKFRLIEYILAYMGFDVLDDVYEMLYNEAYYQREKSIFPKHPFNQYVTGIIIKKKELEKSKKYK